MSDELDFPEIAAPALADAACDEPRQSATSHLKPPEAESIFITREVAAEFRKPVMLYSKRTGDSQANCRERGIDDPGGKIRPDMAR